MARSASGLGLLGHNGEALQRGEWLVPVERSKSKRRQRRMAAGVRAWYTDTVARGRCRRGVALIELDFRGTPVHGEIVGAVRDFWKRYFHKFGRRAYFAWVELQKRGVVHYHAMVCDAPTAKLGHTGPMVQKLWQHGRADVKWRNVGWFEANAGQYATAYTKKLGSKEYQQNYEALPSTVRTYQCSRIASPAGRLQRLPAWAHDHAERRGYALRDARRPRRGGGWVVAVARPGSGLRGRRKLYRWTCRARLTDLHVDGRAGPSHIALGPVVELPWTYSRSRRSR